MDFDWIWEALCDDVRRHFGVASTYFGDAEIWVYDSMAWHFTVEDSFAGPRLGVALIFDDDHLCDEALSHAAWLLNRADIGIHVEVCEGGFIVARHGSMLSAYDGDSLLPIIRMLGDATMFFDQAAREPMSETSPAWDPVTPPSASEVYLAREGSERGGALGSHRDALLLLDSGRDLVPHPRAVPDIDSVTTDCPAVERLPVTGTGAGRGGAGEDASR